MMAYLRLAPWALLGLALLWGGWERDGRKDALLAIERGAVERANAVTQATAAAHAQHLADLEAAATRGRAASEAAAEAAAAAARDTGALVGSLRGLPHDPATCLDSDPGPAVRGLLAGGEGAVPGGGGEGREGGGPG